MSVRFSSPAFSASIPLEPPRFAQGGVRFGAEPDAGKKEQQDEAAVSGPKKIAVKKPGFLAKTGAFFKLLFTFRIFSNKQKLMTRAVEVGNLKLLKTLLDYGVSPDFDYNGKVPMVTLAGKEPKEAIAGMSLLLAADADINLQTSRRINALVRTILDDRYETFRFLLKNGASPDGTTVRDLTPVRLAFSLGRTQMLEDLIAHQADLTRQDNLGQTILDDVANIEAIQKQDFEAMAERIRKAAGQQQAVAEKPRSPDKKDGEPS